MKKSKLFAVFATVIIGGSIVGVLICANPENDENTLNTQQYGQISTEAYMHPDANYYEEGVGETGNAVTIVSSKKKGSHMQIKMQSAGGSVVHIDYQFTTNKFIIYLSE